MTVDVGIVGSYPPPHGGQSVHIRSLARFLRGRGMSVHVLNTGTNKSVEETDVINIGSSRSLLKSLLFGPRYGLVHVHVSGTDDYGKLFPVAVAAAVRRNPWVVTVHSGNSGTKLKTASALRRAATSTLLMTAARVVCVSDAIRDGLSGIVASQKTAVVPPFAVELAPTKPSDELSQFLAGHSPTIVCVGLFEKTYGFDQAIKLMSAIRSLYPRAGLVLVGDSKNADWSRRLIGELHLDSDVFIAGNLSHGECLGLMLQSSLLLRPTLYDGDSLSVREALALGLPVVATATDFRPDGVVTYQADVPGDLQEKALATLSRPAGATGGAMSDYRNFERLVEEYPIVNAK